VKIDYGRTLAKDIGTIMTNLAIAYQDNKYGRDFFKCLDKEWDKHFKGILLYKIEAFKKPRLPKNVDKIVKKAKKKQKESFFKNILTCFHK
jgi:hypothetical protein